jgi:hypothetical protein
MNGPILKEKSKTIEKILLQEKKQKRTSALDDKTLTSRESP